MERKINVIDLKFNEELIEIDKPRKIVIHHTHNPNLTVESTHKLHIERFKWAGIGYNYFIEKNGDIFQGRGMYVGAHAKNHNRDSIGIALAGNFDETLPTEKQIESLIDICLEFMIHYDIEPSRVIGHREIEGVEKTCPGLLFDMNKFRKLLIEKLEKN
ncbi:N-acetylmuramoyl-L-alanine amidase [Clostridium saudiense]|nr:N-acetylmuramoyl-L-alanine amidase [Clostridium saudiense]